MVNYDDEDDRRTIVEVRIPVTGIIKASPYVDQGDVATATLCLDIEIGGFFDSTEEYVEEAVRRLENVLSRSDIRTQRDDG